MIIPFGSSNKFYYPFYRPGLFFHQKNKHMQRHIISHVAIWLLSVIMIIFGLQHFINPRGMINYVPPFIPGGIIWVYFAGAAFILSAISFLLDKWVKLAAYLLASLLFIFVLTIHLPNYLSAGSVDMQQAALVNILKDSAIAAFALHIAGSAHHQKMVY